MIGEVHGLEAELQGHHSFHGLLSRPGWSRAHGTVHDGPKGKYVNGNVPIKCKAVFFNEVFLHGTIEEVDVFGGHRVVLLTIILVYLLTYFIIFEARELIAILLEHC